MVVFKISYTNMLESMTTYLLTSFSIIKYYIFIYYYKRYGVADPHKGDPKIVLALSGAGCP